LEPNNKVIDYFDGARIDIMYFITLHVLYRKMAVLNIYRVHNIISNKLSLIKTLIIQKIYIAGSTIEWHLGSSNKSTKHFSGTVNQPVEFLPYGTQATSTAGRLSPCTIIIRGVHDFLKLITYKRILKMF
jgi:hypothetical protein